MKKFLLLIMLVVLFMLFFLVSASASQWTDIGNAATSFSGGQGTKDDPYQISNAAELAYLSSLANAPTSMYDINPTTDKYFVLTNDINLSGHLWTPIGYDWVSGKSFQGYFDGNNRSVTNMSIRNNGYWYQGLFGIFTDNSGSRSPIYIIMNLSVSGDITIDNANSSYFEVGGIVGSAGATLVNCHSSVNINVKNIGTSLVEYEYYRMSIGGLAGWCYRALNCSSSGYVNLEYLRTSKDDVSYAAVGGLLGTCRLEARNCYSTSDVEVSGQGRSYAGGLIGYCWNDWVVKVFNCYASGNVKAEGSTEAAGALIGSAGTKEIDMQFCYWDDAMIISPLNTINIIIGEGGKQTRCYSFTKGLATCVVNMSQSIDLVEVLQSWVLDNIEYSYYQWWDNEFYIEPYCDWKYSIDADENHGYPTLFLPPESYWAADSDFEYAMRTDGSLMITKYIGSNPIVSIPSIFSNTDDTTTRNVTEIGSRAFENNSVIREVTIPTTITQIGDYAFKNCAHLRAVKFTETAGSSEVPADFGSIAEIQKAEWTVGDGGTSLFPKNSTAKVMDIATGKVFDIKRWSGAYHADCVPLTAADTKTMCDIVGFTYNASHPSSAQLAQIIADTDGSTYTWPDFKGSWSGSSIGSAWDRRAALLNVNGQVYCVSIYGWPHGYNEIKNFQPGPSTNNYYGMMCIHFVGSYTHSGSVDPSHQAAINAAYSYALHYWPDLIKESQLTIGNYAFDGSAIESLQLPRRVSTVGDYAFSNTALSKVIIQNPIITIGENAFQGSSIYDDGIYSYDNTAAKRYARNYLIPFHDLLGAPFEKRWVDNGIVAGSFSGGTGTENDPFLISNGAELGYLSKLVNTGMEGSIHESPIYYALTNDIDLSAHEWVPIGAIEGKQFCGSFDGNGFTVKGMYINNVYECIGLFGMVSRNWREGGLNDIRIRNLSVSGEINILGFTGEPYDFFDIGCIAGQAGYRIENCNSNVIIDISSINNESPDIAAYCVGGLVGNSGDATSNCSSSGSIHINYHNSLSDRLPYLYIGGIASAGGYIRNCFSNVNISVDHEPSINSIYRGVTTGGIVGYGKFISNCYSAGRIEVEQKEGVNEVGNLVGFGDNGDPGILVSNSYWLEDAQVPNDANQDGVGYNGQDSEDCHTFSGNGTQWHIGNTQVSLVSSLNQWVTAQDNDQCLAWQDAASSQDNGGYPVLVSRLIDLGDAGISGIESDDVVFQGGTVTFVAVGAGMNNPDVLGYRRWRPYSWRTNPSGTWSSAPYRATFSTKDMSLGVHDLTVTLIEEEYALDGWRATGRSTTIVVPYTLVKKVVLPKTGDNSMPALWLILCLISGVGLVSVLKRTHSA